MQTVTTGISVIKTFITGIVLGIAGVIAALYVVPVVDQHREQSIISMSTNGGNSEAFHVNIPMDRIMLGDAASKHPMPQGMEWPDAAMLDDTRVELFKLRDSRNTVIGVASRLAANDDDIGSVIEWVLHMPARGSIFVGLDPVPVDGGRVGPLHAGTREFESLVGSLSERWVAEASSVDDTRTGRIELLATFVSSEPVDTEAESELGGDVE